MTNTQTTRLGKQHLLEIAEQLFTEHGYQAVSIRDIAQASGVTNAALYYHFSSKEALFDEVLQHHAGKLARRMEQAGAEVIGTQEKLHAILWEYSQLVYERRSLFLSLRRKSAEVNQETVKNQHAQMVQQMLAPLEDTLQQAINNSELRQLSTNCSPAYLLLGLFHGMLQHRKHREDYQITPDDIELVIKIFINGMKQQGET